MTRAITFNITLEEAALLAAPGGDPNTESSLAYIPGGAIRGALVAAYLRDGGSSEKQSFRDLFLNGRTRYLNAYPRLTARALPTPRTWAVQKDGAAAENEDYPQDEHSQRVRSVYDRVDEGQRSAVEKGLPQGLKEAFIAFSAAAAGGQGPEPITPPRVDFEIAVHTARNREMGRALENDSQSALFRYQALARDQVFAAAVVVDDAVAAADYDRLPALLRGGLLLVGGSHKAGYGLTRVSEVAEAEQWREVDGPRADVAAGKQFSLWLTSDAILHDPQTGRPTTDVRPFLPGGPGGYTVVHSFAAAGWVGGFNKHWGLPLPQQWAARMGSVWVIEAENGLSASAIEALERQGIGARTAEGFGQVIVTPIYPAKPGAKTPFDMSAAASITTTAVPVADKVTAHADLLVRMNERIVRAELDRLLAAAVNRLAEKKHVRGRLSRSQLGRLQVRIRHEAHTNNFDGFLNYLRGTEKRKSADDQFRRFTVGGKIFRDRLTGLAQAPQTVWNEFVPQGWQPPVIDLKAYDYKTDRLAHDYTVRFIANLCRQLSKLEVEP